MNKPSLTRLPGIGSYQTQPLLAWWWYNVDKTKHCIINYQFYVLYLHLGHWDRRQSWGRLLGWCEGVEWGGERSAAWLMVARSVCVCKIYWLTGWGRDIVRQEVRKTRDNFARPDGLSDLLAESEGQGRETEMLLLPQSVCAYYVVCCLTLHGLGLPTEQRSTTDYRPNRNGPHSVLLWSSTVNNLTAQLE